MTDTPATATPDLSRSAVAISTRFAIFADILDGFTDGIDYARLAAGLHWVRHGDEDAPGHRADLEALFAAPWQAAKDEGEFDGDPAFEGRADLERVSSEARQIAQAAAGPSVFRIPHLSADEVARLKAGFGARGGGVMIPADEPLTLPADLDALAVEMAKAHDQEEAAQRGEPSPWDLGGPESPDEAGWVSERTVAMREALNVALKALGV